MRDALLGMMRAGTFAPGDRLPAERDLAQRFGVSRTTLRDALHGLELLGYVESRQGDGTVVRQPGPAALATPFRTLLRGRPHLGDDLLEFRRLLEPAIAALAAERRRPADVAALEASLQRQRRLARRGERMLDEDVAFHRLLASAADNDTVQHVLDTLHTLLQEQRSRLLGGGDPELAVRQHEAIVRAVVDGDPAAAQAAALAHLESVGRSLAARPAGRPLSRHAPPPTPAGSPTTERTPMDAPPFDASFPYTSQRMPVLADAAVATSQPLAAQAGLRALEQGGNAIDAAVAAAMTLTVVEPCANGIGSDAFALVWEGGALHGLNASGRSPRAWTPQRLQGQERVPERGWDAVTVPGAVSAWVALWRRFGRLPLEAVAASAVRYAEEGYLVGPMTAAAWARAATVHGDRPDFAEAFLPNGRPPAAGERFRLVGAGRTLRRIAETEGEAFYRGELAERIAAHARATGGVLDEQDLAEHEPAWVEPLSMAVGDARLHELPPNGQGIAALMALGIAIHAGIEDLPVDSVESLHVQIEAMKLAFADLHAHVADPGAMAVPPEALIDDGYLAARARLVDRSRAARPRPGVPGPGGTVYLCAADAEGTMVSYIQSNYMGFGSGVVVPGTGISLQNRGAGFVLDEGHPNRLDGAKRPLHTIIPAFLTRAEAPLSAFGVMGGPMQAQGHLQVTLRHVVYGQNGQSALDAPRWQVLRDGATVAIEPGLPTAVYEGLAALGHPLERDDRVGFSQHFFGGGQGIWRLPGGGYLAASDPRREGQAVGA